MVQFRQPPGGAHDDVKNSAVQQAPNGRCPRTTSSFGEADLTAILLPPRRGEVPAKPGMGVQFGADGCGVPHADAILHRNNRNEAGADRVAPNLISEDDDACSLFTERVCAMQLHTLPHRYRAFRSEQASAKS